MPSCPGLFLVLSCLSRDSTSAGEIILSKIIIFY